MVREDLVTSAVDFLRDPSVAAAPLQKRVDFLKAKNLTQEEIDISLARAGEAPSSAAAQAPPPQNYTYRQPPPPQQYGYPPTQGYWQQPPPEPPKRDWRDYFIMATVMGGVGYGMYFVAKRYVMPLIAPPTPPQIEQDKAAVDEAFTRAFTLLDQLSTDTAELKKSEESRTSRLDNAIGEMESVLASLKDSSKRRDDDSRRIEDDVRSLRDLIPKALESQKENTDKRLLELGTELKSLKTLVGNRMGTGVPTSARTGAGSSLPGIGAGANMFGAQGTASTATGASSPAMSSTTQPNSNAPLTSPNTSSGTNSEGQVLGSSTPERAQTSNPYGRLAGGRAAIPAWQMAAQKKAADAAGETKKDTAESGTVETAAAGES